MVCSTLLNRMQKKTAFVIQEFCKGKSPEQTSNKQNTDPVLFEQKNGRLQT